MQVPSCVDCKHSAQLDSGKMLCKLKATTFMSEDGGTMYDNRFAHCITERLDSTGFFGLFKDNTRCGTAGKNFYPKK